MAFEIPSDLIRDLQLALRREAGVPDYEPSISEADAGDFDLSPVSHIRCHLCRGELLDVCHTTICIHCGAEQRNNGIPAAMSFKSTFAFRGLLDFLGLNGSETVSLEPEKSDSRTGGETPTDGLVLSDLLDLELRWPLGTEEIDTESTTKAPPPSTHSLNLSGVDLDTFFSGTANEKVSADQGASNEHLNHKKETEKPEGHFTSSESLGFFADFQSSDATVVSVATKGDEFGGSFANWEAEFQSASSESSALDSKSSNFFQGSSTTDLVIPTTAAVKTGIEDEKSPKSNIGEPTKDENTLSSSGSWMQDGLWGPLDKKLSNTVDQFKSDGETAVLQVKDNPAHMISASAVGIQDDLWTSSSKVELNSTTIINENDDLFDDWQDFTSSSEAPGVVSNSGVQIGTGTTAYEDSSKAETADLNNLEYGDFFDSAVSFGAQGGQAPSISKELSSNTTITNDTDIFDGWLGFTSSGKAMDNFSNSQIKPGKMNAQPRETESVDLQHAEFGDYLLSSSSGAIDGLNPSSSQRESNDTKITADGDDLFDDWQEFTGTGNAPGHLSNSNEQLDADTSKLEPSSKVKVSTFPLDLPDMGSVDFYTSASSSGVVEGQKGSSEVKMTRDASVSDWMNGAHDEVGTDSTFLGATGITENHDAASNMNTAEANTKRLLSQMHDLSFMLDNDLSVPKKA